MNTKLDQLDAGALHCTKLTASHEVLKYIGENSNKIPLDRLKKRIIEVKTGTKRKFSPVSRSLGAVFSILKPFSLK